MCERGSGYREVEAYIFEDAGEDFLKWEDAAQGIASQQLPALEPSLDPELLPQSPRELLGARAVELMMNQEDLRSLGHACRVPHPARGPEK